MSDYISRQAVLEILSSRNAAWDGYNKVMDMPAADVRENVKGEWIILPPCFEEICQCSRCGKKYRVALQRTNFCPSCGADMRGESDES